MTDVGTYSQASAAQSFGAAARPARRSAAGGRLITWLRAEGTIVFLASLVAYIVVGILLDFVFYSFMGDAFSRLANGYYVFFSRDPHLAAIGFVWNPLPTVASMPLLLFKPIWPALVTHMFAGSLSGAVAMAGAAYQVNRILDDMAVPRAARIVLTVLFAANPLILYYGGNGMSEALYVFTMVLTTRHLLRWFRDAKTTSLVYAASALGLAYLARNEAAGAGLVAVVAVVWVSYARAAGSGKQRFKTSIADGVIFFLPVFTAVAGWAIVSDVIIGAPFAQFTSQYGNSSQLAIAGQTAGHYGARLWLETRSMESMAPLLPLLLAGSVYLAVKRRNFLVLAPIVILGGGIGFDIVAYLSNHIFYWLRFFIVTIPLGIVLTGYVLVELAGIPIPAPGAARRTTRLRPGTEPVVSPPSRKGPVTAGALAGVALIAFAACAPTLASTAAAMANPTLGPEEHQQLLPVFASHPTEADKLAVNPLPWLQSVSWYLTGLHLPNGDVLMDTFGACSPALDLTAPNPKLFVITNDRDFQRVLSDPLTFHTHYLLVPQPSGLGGLDEINKTYPSLYGSGEGFATLAHQFTGIGGCPQLRLYKAYTSPNQLLTGGQ
ncbi:MAG TPA: hypothetical protein VGS21_00225 [Acidimicrobiales bacterium]|nr:hypothetical protein [Acidimicrobiales bacterium]